MAHVRWALETLNTLVEHDTGALPVGLRTRLLRSMLMVAAHGPVQQHVQQHEPHVQDIDGRLRERRVKAAEGIALGMYVTTGPRVVVLNVSCKDAVISLPAVAS